MRILEVNKVKSLDTLSDPELWSLLKQGDRLAFQTIYSRYLKDLLNFGYHLVPERSMVKDCLHDLFLDIWIRKSHLSDVKHIKYYLFKALSRRILEQKAQRKKDLSLNPSPEHIPYKIILPFEQKLIDEQDGSMKSRRIMNAIKQLSDRQNQVINLLYYEGFSYEEVSNIMNINLRSVYTLAWKAMKVLRRELKHFITFVLWLLFCISNLYTLFLKA